MLFSRIIFIAVSPSVILLDVKSFLISVFSYFVVEKVINIKLGFLKMFLRVLLNCTIIGSLKYKKVKKKIALKFTLNVIYWLILLLVM